MPRLASGTILAAGMLTTLMVATSAYGQTAWYEGFEGPEPTWRDAGGNAQYRIQRHQRVQGEAHTGDGCEWLIVRGTGGTYVHIGHEVDRPRVIDELLITVWIKSDRPGLQLVGRVVLPRTTDPRSGGPVSTWLHGSTYSNVGRWQQLRIDDVPRLLARQLRVLRSQLGPHVDAREAYIDHVLLNVYGGPGATDVRIDDLDIAGHVSARPVAEKPVAGSQNSGGDPAGDVARGGLKRRAIALVGSVLMVEGRPVFPRIIRHQGEPLAFLKQLGFNAVWLKKPASLELLAEAERLGLWLVCPPPRPTSLYMPEDRVTPLPQLGPEYDRVLAWDLGQGLSQEQLELTRGWAEQVRLADRRQARPLICQPQAELRAYSRHVDLLLIDRRPLGTSLELAAYGRWICRQPWLARPGTSIWTTVQTQPAAALCRQLSLLEPGRQTPLAVASEQVRLLAYTAVASGSRGLLFESQTPLCADDPETRHRAMTLELLNLELQLIEPWAAAGSVLASASASRREVLGTVLRTDRTRLLLPIWSEPGAQWVPGQSAANGISLVVPGVPESSRAYELRPGGLRPLRDQPTTGGVRVTLDEFGLTGAVLFAHDPLIINSLTRRAAAIGPRAAELQRHLAARKLDMVPQVLGRLGRLPEAVEQSAGWMDAARKSIQSCDGRLAARDYQGAYLHARRAMRSLRLIEEACWRLAVRGLTSPLSSPATVSFATLPWHGRLSEQIGCSVLGPNRLQGGDFENLSVMLEAGWNHFQHPLPGLHTKAELLPDAARSGFSGLRLTAQPDDPDSPPAMIETPPVWVTSPAVPVEAGQLVCIEGWVQIPKAISGSVDGLLIIDSLGGEPLAQRIGKTAGWKRFTFYRASPQSGRMTVTFALSGLGEVRLDDVSIRRLLPADTNGVARFPRIDDSSR